MKLKNNKLSEMGTNEKLVERKRQKKKKMEEEEEEEEGGKNHQTKRTKTYCIRG